MWLFNKTRRFVYSLKFLGQIIIGLALSLSVARAEIALSGTLTTDYLFEGITQTQHDPAIQGSIEYQHDSGLYLGIWGSNVDFGVEAEGIEIDLYLGIADSLSENWQYDLGYLYYTYRGDEGLEDASYSELSANLTWQDNTAFHLWLADDQGSFGGKSIRFKISHSIALPDEYFLNLAYHNWHTDWAMWDNDDDNSLGETSYGAFQVGLSTAIADFDLDISYSSTSIKNREDAEDRLMLMITKNF